MAHVKTDSNASMNQWAEQVIKGLDARTPKEKQDAADRNKKRPVYQKRSSLKVK